MTVWFRSLSTTGKSLASLGAALALGSTIALAAVGWRGLPAQVNTNTKTISEIQRTHSSLEQKVDQIICLQLLTLNQNPSSCIP